MGGKRWCAMIRVLHIGLSDSFGGIESFLLNLGRATDMERFCFDYVAYGAEVPCEDEFLALGGKVLRLTNRSNPISYSRELCSFMGRGYDVVHIHKNSAADIVPFLCARRIRGLKIVSHAHSTRSGAGAVASAFNMLGRSVVVRSSDIMLACSAVAADWLYGSAAGRATLIPNGIDLSRYVFDPVAREKVREELGVGGAIVVGCVGRFKAEKNQAFLVGVLKSLECRGIDAYALFLGDGAEIDSVKCRFAQENLGTRAIFLGSVRDVASYMQAMDVLAMPSLFEGFPLVAVEGQAAGLPVLLSDRITEEVCLTERAVRLPLGEGTEPVWGEAIMKQVSECTRSGADLSLLAPFDSKTTASIVGEVYVNAVE